MTKMHNKHNQVSYLQIGAFVLQMLIWLWNFLEIIFFPDGFWGLGLKENNL